MNTQLIFVTSTYDRPRRLRYLSRCIRVFKRLDNLLWLVIEDASKKDPLVEQALIKSGIPYRYFYSGPFHNKGNEQKDYGLSYIKDNKIEGIVYIADDDNYYDIRLFDEIRKTKNISIFPVGNLGPHNIEKPIIKNGKIMGWTAGWPDRKYPVDWAGIALNANVLQKLSHPLLKGLGPYGENEFLEKCINSVVELEPLCKGCRDCYVWHNQPLYVGVSLVKLRFYIIKFVKALIPERLRKILKENFITNLPRKTGVKLRSKIPTPKKIYVVWKSREIDRLILKTPPFDTNINSGTQIHSLVCNRDFTRYILAIKSFLRFYRDVGVVVHDDGTLSGKQKNILAGHIRNIRIIDKKDADQTMRKVLRNYPYSLMFRGSKEKMLQVFDFKAFCATKKMIMLDSDTLFLSRPGEIIDWIINESRSILYVYEDDPCVQKIDGVYVTHLAGIPFKFAKHLCGGFVCCYSSIFDPDLIESYCKYIDENCRDWACRYRAQGITALCVGSSGYDPVILSGKYQNPPRFGDREIPVFRHYWFSLGLRSRYFQDSKEIIKEIRRLQNK